MNLSVDYATALVRGLSQDRLNSFRTPGDTDLQALARYMWNIEIAAAFHPSLELLEVTLRNSIDAEMSATYKKAWLSSTSPVLLPRQHQIISDAETDLAKASITRQSPAFHGALVASLPFGFWTALMSGRYAGGLVAPGVVSPVALWPLPLMAAFPSAPQGASRRTVADRFHTIRNVRNRVFHHEALWQGRRLPNGTTLLPIDQEVEISDALGWMSPEVSATAVALSRLTSVYQSGPAPLEALIVNFGLPRGWVL